MTRAASKKAGHWWLWGADVRGQVLRRAVVRVHRVYGRGPLESVEESPLLAADLATCGTCGLVAAEFVVDDPYDGTRRTLHAVGVDLDSLAVTGSAPPCEPHSLCRPPSSTAYADRNQRAATAAGGTAS